MVMPPKDDLYGVIRAALPKMPEQSVLLVTSKIVSIGEGACAPMAAVKRKDDLIKREADFYLPWVPNIPWVMHTIKNNLFIPTAGIDESNGNGYYILWPRNPKRSAKKFYDWVRKTYRVRDVGVIITDSHTIPLRRGVMGISLAHYGFAPLNDYRDKKDLFGRGFTMTQTNVADGLAAAAVLAMGEGNEATPLAMATDLPFVRFTDKPIRSRRKFSSFEIKTDEDLYYPLLSAARWKKGGGGFER